jgi:predicted phage terminase large subunit-like protein
VIPIRPHPGPQEAFLKSRANIAIYGGAAGGGKSHALLLGALIGFDKPKYSAVLFRRTYPELIGGGSLWARANELYRPMGAKPREDRLDFTFPSGALVEFSHLQHEKNIYAHQSKEYAFCAFDELTHFTESQFWYLLSRNRSTSGIKPHMRGATNPDPASWVRSFISWWLDDVTGLAIPERSGVLRWMLRMDDKLEWADSQSDLAARFPDDAHRALSVTFVPAKLDDNPALLKVDPQYRDRLMALPRVEREQLLGGNWNIRPAAGLYFRRSYFPVVEVAPNCASRIRWWDKAATAPSPKNRDPDWTRGVLMGRTQDGRFVIEHVESLRGSPRKVEEAILRMAQLDGRDVRVGLWQDPGQAGVVDIDNMRKVLAGFSVQVERASNSKVTYAGPYSSQAEGQNVILVRGSWNECYLNEHEAFPDGPHDDIVDAASGAFLGLTKYNTELAAPVGLNLSGGASLWRV